MGRSLACRLAGVNVPSYPGHDLIRAWVTDLSLTQKVQSVVGAFKRIRRRKLRIREVWTKFETKWS